jgi:hypothetical protein
MERLGQVVSSLFPPRRVVWRGTQSCLGTDSSSSGVDNSVEAQSGNSDLQAALNQFTGHATEDTVMINRSRLQPAGSRTSRRIHSANANGTMQAPSQSESARVHSFLVLPSCKSPRWLFPLGNRRTSLHGLQICEPYRPASRLLKALLAGAIQAGWRGWGCDRLMLETSKPLALERLVQKITAEKHPAFALSLGLPHRYRKLVIQAMRPGGEVLGYIKLPLTEAAHERVRHEAKVLNELWGFQPLRPHIPQVFYADEWEDSSIFFESPGPTRPAGVELGPMHEQFLRTLWSVQRVEKEGDTLVSDVARQWNRVEPFLNSEWRELGAAALDRARQILTGRKIPCGVAHGDFDPCNTRISFGRLFVFDWETASWDVPNSWDIFYFHLMSGNRVRAKSAIHFTARLEPWERGSFLLFLLRSLSESFEGGTAPDHSNVEFRKQLLVGELELLRSSPS